MFTKQRTELLRKVLNLLAMSAWMQSEQLRDHRLDIFAGLIDAFSQLSGDYTGINNCNFFVPYQTPPLAIKL